MTERRNKNNINYASAVIMSVVVVFLSAAGAKLFAASNGFDFGGLTGIFCVILAAAFFACLLFITNYLTIFAVCAASAGLAIFAGKEPLPVILALSYILTGLIIFTGMAKKQTRTQITVRVSLFLVLFCSAWTVLYFVITSGGFSVQKLSNSIDDEINNTLNYMETAASQYYSMLPAGSVSSADASGDGTAYNLSDSVRQEFIMNMKVMIPSLFVILCIFCAYLSTSSFRIFYNIFSAKSKPKEIPGRDWRVKLSVISAGVMILSTLCMVLLYDKDNLLPSIVSANIMYILLPGFCIMGIYFVYDKLYNMYNRVPYRKKNGTLPGLSLAFAVIFLYIFMSNIVFAALAIFGLYAALIGDIKNFYDKAKKYFSDGGGGDDDDGDDF